MEFDVIQSFYIDSTAVNGAPEVFLTSVDLFFSTKPPRTGNLSGIKDPGVFLSIVDVEMDEPVLTNVIQNSNVRVGYDNVYAMSDASTPTKFSFSTPVVLKSSKFYAFVVYFEDPGFILWENTQGDRLLGTNTPSTGSHNIGDGKYYLGNGTELKALNNTDLKFKVNIAKFTANTASYKLVNADYEFLTINPLTGTLQGGEWVYANTSVASGTVNVVKGNTIISGTGTSFASSQEDSYFVLKSGTDVNVLKIDYVVNSTMMSVYEAPSFSNSSAQIIYTAVGKIFHKNEIKNKLFLYNSTANSSNKFSNGTIIIGEISKATANVVNLEDYYVDAFLPKFNQTTSSTGSLNVSFTIASNTGSVFEVSNNFNTIQQDELVRVRDKAGVIRSRSLEVDTSTLYSSERKSSRVLVDLTINKSNTFLFSSPYLKASDIKFLSSSNKISNTVYSGLLDTEILRNGIALSKHISSKITFSNNRFAEDVKVFLTGYRPSGTDIKVYCKLHNSSDVDAFDDKNWTPLTISTNSDKFSSSSNTSDIIEYSYSLPKFSETSNSIPGSFTSQSANAVILSNGVDPTTYVSVNDMVKLYDPLFPDNRMVAIVSAANSTSITLSSKVSNNNVIGSGMKLDKLRYPNIAFNNNLNDNICRYYNSVYSAFDKFDSMQLKVVLLSTNTHFTPYLNQIEFIGVSS